MKNIFTAIIKKGGYDLTEILQKIDTYHIEGKLTDGERDELYALARGDAKPAYDVEREIERLWAAVRELRGESDTTEPDGDTVEEFVQPAGAHDAYQTGDLVLYKGTTYRCVTDNCVWSPDVLPSAWEIL